MSLRNYLQQIKPYISKTIWQSSSRLYYALLRAAMWPQASFHPWRRSSIHHLADFQNRHQGSRCFIIGNGPSLINTDLTRLKNEFTFGLNRIYLLFPRLGFHTTYFVSVNNLVIEQCLEEIASLVMPRFLSWRSHRIIKQHPELPIHPEHDTIFLHTTYSGPLFAKDARGRLWEGATVTYVALQLAYFMGFQQVILIGVDHNFSTQGKPNTPVVSSGDDRDHFDKGYFGRGFTWQLPDLVTSEKAYRMAHEAYQLAGRQVLDATIGGKLTIFPKVNYDDLF